jgi:hypothetical protein
MSARYGTPPGGYGIPTQRAPQFAPGSPGHGIPQQYFGAPQQYGQQQYGQQHYGQQHYGAQQFAPDPHNHATPQPTAIPPQPSNPEPPRRSNGIATAGLVVAIVGAVLSLIPVIGTVAWGLAPIGLVLSVIGLVRSKQARNGRGASIAGIVLSVVALIMCVLYTILFSAVASGVTTAQQQGTAVHNVTYKVTTAKGTRIASTYSQSRDNNLASGSITDAGSPWSANAQVSGFMGPTVTASLSSMTKSDRITCTIIEDGVQVAQQTASGMGATVTCAR